MSYSKKRYWKKNENVRGLEEALGAAESFGADGDDVAIGELVGLLLVGGLGRLLHLGVEVEGHVGELLLDVAHNFALGGGGEGVTALGQDLHHVLGQSTTGQIQTQDSVGKGVTFVDGDAMGHTITGIHNDTGRTTGGVQRQHGLDGNVHRGDVERLEHDLGHAFTIRLGIERGLGQKHGVLLGGDTQFVVESVMPDLFHIVPVGDDTVFDRVLQGEDTTLGLCFIADVGILLVHTDHDARHLRATDDRGEDGAWRVIASETGFAHTYNKLCFTTKTLQNTNMCSYQTKKKNICFA